MNTRHSFGRSFTRNAGEPRKRARLIIENGPTWDIKGSAVGAPKAARNGATTSMPSQPGRLGGDSTSPRRLSSGPPQLMPMPARVAGRSLAGQQRGQGLA